MAGMAMVFTGSHYFGVVYVAGVPSDLLAISALIGATVTALVTLVHEDG
jgi:hypothetical protein